MHTTSLVGAVLVAIAAVSPAFAESSVLTPPAKRSATASPIIKNRGFTTITTSSATLENRDAATVTVTFSFPPIKNKGRVAAAPILENREVTTVTVSGSTATTYPQPASDIQGFPIHQSCNNTEKRQLEKALGDTIKIAQQAAQHIYTHGNESALYTKYFGQAPTAEVIGWYEKLIHGDHEGVLFRCDDIDGNCHQEGWGGHWHGENGTDETVICPLSFSTRQPLEALCAGGYTVAYGRLNHYFAADLMHRLYHTTKIGEGAADHYADSYTECLALAVENPAEAVRNTHSLQYFALDVYAMDVALPGEGCAGRPDEEESGSSAASTPASTPTPALSASSIGAATTSSTPEVASQTASRTSSAAAECHTHADGVVHCV